MTATTVACDRCHAIAGWMDPKAIDLAVKGGWRHKGVQCRACRQQLASEWRPCACALRANGLPEPAKA